MKARLMVDGIHGIPKGTMIEVIVNPKNGSGLCHDPMGGTHYLAAASFDLLDEIKDDWIESRINRKSLSGFYIRFFAFLRKEFGQ